MNPVPLELQPEIHPTRITVTSKTTFINLKMQTGNFIRFIDISNINKLWAKSMSKAKDLSKVREL